MRELWRLELGNYYGILEVFPELGNLGIPSRVSKAGIAPTKGTEFPLGKVFPGFHHNSQDFFGVVASPPIPLEIWESFSCCSPKILEFRLDKPKLPLHDPTESFQEPHPWVFPTFPGMGTPPLPFRCFSMEKIFLKIQLEAVALKKGSSRSVFHSFFLDALPWESMGIWECW